MALDFTSLEDMRALVVEKTGLTAPSDLDNLLDYSAGETKADTPVKTYRPYYVAGYLLRTRVYQLIEGEGARFLEPLKMADKYMSQQRALDSRLDLTVPDGMEADSSNAVGSKAIVRG